MNNWETEFEVKYSLTLTDDLSRQEVKTETLIIEASSKSEVINIMKHRFQYSENLHIDEIKELWKY
jgi:hypothetical protein|tara:strand:- start:318 stop:515 length:198 start_codon:yes stop_codon:yes gene_type:complete